MSRAYPRTITGISDFGPVVSNLELERSTPQIDDDPPSRPKRTYVRKATIVASGVVPPTSPPQLADLAFNIHGWALEDGMINRSTFEVINAYNATMIKGGFRAKIREFQAQVADVYRNDLTYTLRELDVHLANTNPSVSRYLVIGYTLREDDPIYANNRTFARYSENELVGEACPAEQHVIRWNQCQTPILVVTPIKENTGTSIRLFGLVMPRSGLCQPVLLTHERIFYRWEYRASAGARSNQRNKNWNQVVIDKALSLSQEYQQPHDRPNIEAPRSVGQLFKSEETDLHYLETSGRRSSEGDVFELKLDLEELFEPLAKAHGVVNTTQLSSGTVITCFKILLNSGEIQGLLDAIRRARNDRVRTEVEAHLHKVNKTEGSLPEDYPALIRFADAGYHDTDISLAFDTAEAIKELWPHLDQIANVNALVRIKTIVNQTQQSINEDSLENVLRTLLSAIHYNDRITDAALNGRFREVVYSNHVIQNSTRRTSGASDREMPLAIDARFLVMLLKDAMAIHEWQNTAKAHLSHNVPASYNGQMFEHVIDIDVSQLTLQDVRGALRWIVNHSVSKSCDTADILLWLERLRHRIRQASYG